jgi:hypothetical protein
MAESPFAFPSDEALIKMLYLATMDVIRKWTGRVQNWSQMLLQFSIFSGPGRTLREIIFFSPRGEVLLKEF